jgi:hypothetical protein
MSELEGRFKELVAATEALGRGLGGVPMCPDDAYTVKELMISAQEEALRLLSVAGKPMGIKDLRAQLAARFKGASLIDERKVTVDDILTYTVFNVQLLLEEKKTT